VAWPNQPSFKQKIPISFPYSTQPTSLTPGVVQTWSKPQWDAAKIGPIFQKAIATVVCLVSNLIHIKGWLEPITKSLPLQQLHCRTSSQVSYASPTLTHVMLRFPGHSFTTIVLFTKTNFFLQVFATQCVIWNFMYSEVLHKCERAGENGIN